MDVDPVAAMDALRAGRQDRGSLWIAMPVQKLDITNETCPMTFVRTRLALDRMASGEILLVRLLGEEPRRNVVLNAEALGHAVLSDEPDQDDARLVAIRRR